MRAFRRELTRLRVYRGQSALDRFSRRALLDREDRAGREIFHERDGLPEIIHRLIHPIAVSSDFMHFINFGTLT